MNNLLVELLQKNGNTIVQAIREHDGTAARFEREFNIRMALLFARAYLLVNKEIFVSYAETRTEFGSVTCAWHRVRFWAQMPVASHYYRTLPAVTQNGDIFLFEGNGPFTQSFVQAWKVQDILGVNVEYERCPTNPLLEATIYRCTLKQ